MKCYTHSINSLFINAWPTRSSAIQNAAGFHKIFKLSLNAVSVRRACPNSFLNLRCTAVGDFNLWYQRTHCAFCSMVKMFHSLLQTYVFIKNDLFLLILTIK